MDAVRALLTRTGIFAHFKAAACSLSGVVSGVFDSLGAGSLYPGGPRHRSWVSKPAFRSGVTSSATHLLGLRVPLEPVRIAASPQPTEGVGRRRQNQVCA
jgi:hypothetical protein